MSFKLTIRNFSKLSEAEVHIGRFTVFAGPNNTGKSSVSKLLYSLFDGMNVNHALVEFDSLMMGIRSSMGIPAMIKEDFEGIYRRSAEESKAKSENIERKQVFPSLDTMSNTLNLMRSSIVDAGDDFGKLEQAISFLLGSTEDLKDSCENLENELKEFSATPNWVDTNISDSVSQAIESCNKGIDSLREHLSSTNPRSFVVAGIEKKIKHNLTENFQVSDFSLLRNERNIGAEIDIEGVGRFQISNGNKSIFDIQSLGLEKLQQYSRVIYLESPVYWKLKSALEDVRMSPRYTSSLGRKRISGVPGYFYDLARAVRDEYTGDIAFPEVYDKLISKEVMGGKLALSETGELSFQEGERNFSLHLTAMGIVNLGMIALLIERKIIDKGTFLFIDEPEAHLHPAWQIKMAKTLFELAKGGVNVVIATHSADILKFLEVEVKNNPESENLIALNHFTPAGVRNGASDFDVQLADIQAELTEPFAKLFIRGV